jgi:(1->4)-alpha-D-glucan 1-alpha-D-glucosylmutase
VLTRPITATYRLQLRPGFGFGEAVAIVPYLAQLQISHLYLSPIFEAATGSQHGYDVVDPTAVRGELGGRRGFDALVQVAHRHGMGVVLDLVPHHMATSHENPWWWDVLRKGEDSPFAHYFDIDWRPPEPRLAGKVLLPVLGDHYGRVLDAGELVLERRDGEVVARYHEHLAPLSEETASELVDDAAIADVNADVDRLDALLERQHHRFARWQAAAYELDYRRFFDIDSLVATRSEHEDVFDATHALTLELVRDGAVDGLRIDHIDGLRDPGGYLERLRSRTPDTWILVEKILRTGEQVPDDWPVDGTTGYEHMARVTGLLTEPDGWRRLVTAYQGFTGDERSFAAVTEGARREVLESALVADLNRVVALLVEVCEARRQWRDYTRAELREALAEVAVQVDAYRSYLRAGHEPSPTDQALVGRAIDRAAKGRPDLDAELLEALRSILLGREPGDDVAAVVDRFQQLTAPLAAKGEEDTALYRWVPYLPANEVGGNPADPLLDIDRFHAAQQEVLARWPQTMLAGSTHDTKRSEDVRARLAVLSERPEAFIALVARAAASAGAVDPEMQWFVHQTFVGAHPLPAERAREVMVKSMREAKVHTSWTRPEQGYEGAVLAWVDSLYGDASYQAALDAIVAELHQPGRVNSLVEVVLRTLCPGVPDTYQGCELWDDSLVDPDNRRAVDFARRDAMLAEAVTVPLEQLWHSDDGTGIAKLAVLRQCLELRHLHPDAFGAAGSYEPLVAGNRLLAFARGGTVVAVVPLRNAGGLPDDEIVVLPHARWRSALSDAVLDGGEHPFGAVRAGFPVAVLVKD